MYTNPTRPNEIYHYGIPHRSGRYPCGSGERPHQSLEGKQSKMEGKLTKAFDRTDARVAAHQKKANRYFEKADSQRLSLWGFRRKAANNTFAKGYLEQNKVSRLNYKMSKRYKRLERKFEKLNIVMNEDLKRRGKEYYNRAVEQSKDQYKVWQQQIISE